MFKLLRLWLPVIFLLLAAGPVGAANEGQEDLDKATDTKLNANTLSDLSEVVRLAESALKKGLDPDNTAFANKLLASTLLQRSHETVKQIVAGVRSPDDFRQKRRFALSDLERVVQLDPKQSEALLLIAQLNGLPGGDAKAAREAVDKALALGFAEPLAQAKALRLRAGLQEQPEKQLADLDEAVRLAPGDLASIRTRGFLLADLGKLEPALADLDKALELAPKDGPLYEAKAMVLARLKKYDEALATLAKARELNPDAVMPLVQQARVHSQQAKLDAALDDLTQALALDSGNVAVLLMRASVYQEKGEREKALADVDHALKLRPELPLAIRTRAVLLAESKRFDDAVVELEKLRKLNPKDTLTLLQLAMLYGAQKQPEKAIETFTALLALDPNEWRALGGRGDAYLNAGKQAEADADYQQAIGQLEKLRKLNPKDTPTLLQLATLYNNQKKPDKAIETLTALLALDPNEWQALGRRGDTYLNLGKQAEAIADYEQAIKLQPKDQHVLNNLAWVLATSPDEKLRNGSRAIELATQACEATEFKLAYILSTLAAAYAESGDFDSAVKWSTKAVALGDKDQDDQLKKELESYQAKKPWRELVPEEKPAKKKEAAKKEPKTPEQGAAE